MKNDSINYLSLNSDVEGSSAAARLLSESGVANAFQSLFSVQQC
jgi:hypothetical protein